MTVPLNLTFLPFPNRPTKYFIASVTKISRNKLLTFKQYYMKELKNLKKKKTQALNSIVNTSCIHSPKRKNTTSTREFETKSKPKTKRKRNPEKKVWD